MSAVATLLEIREAVNPADPVSLLDAALAYLEREDARLTRGVYYDVTDDCFCAAGLLRFLAGGSLEISGTGKSQWGALYGLTQPASDALYEIITGCLRFSDAPLPVVNDQAIDSQRVGVIREVLTQAREAFVAERVL